MIQKPSNIQPGAWQFPQHAHMLQSKVRRNLVITLPAAFAQIPTFQRIADSFLLLGTLSLQSDKDDLTRLLEEYQNHLFFGTSTVVLLNISRHSSVQLTRHPCCKGYLISNFQCAAE